ncbi:hypothetical protein [Streptomyces kaempferi]|uniref:Uncharacterized protein n=1 Tax=Streptomyces kaempferi TaxID=333725 RepID=A0ABW3XDX0_9ACTN
MTAINPALAAAIADKRIPLSADWAPQSTITGFMAALSGGDLPADAVREERCLKAPIGCGQPLIAEDGSTRVFWGEEEAGRYEAEWRITGLCPDCQDVLAADEEAAS